MIRELVHAKGDDLGVHSGKGILTLGNLAEFSGAHWSYKTFGLMIY